MPANLGLASNEEMMRELICRFKMEQYTNGSDISVHRAIERALILSEMIGSMDAPEREYRVVDGEERQQVPYTPKRVKYNNPIKNKPVKRGPRGSKKERDIRNTMIYGMHVQGRTNAQIADTLGLSAEHVRQLVSKKKDENDALVILEKAMPSD